MNEITEPKKTKNGRNKPLRNSIAGTAALFGDEKNIEKVFKPFVKTGILEIDTMLGGGFTPGLAVLGAISNLGKSTFALQMAANIAKNGTPVLFFSLEMPAEWIAAKLISQRTFIDAGKDANSAVMAKELVNESTVRSDAFQSKWKAVKKAVHVIAEELQDLYIIDAKSDEYLSNNKRLTAEEIREKVITFMRENPEKPKPFVIIDYLQIIPMYETKKGFTNMQEIDHNIDVLSKIDKDITVLLISSINRGSYNAPMNLSSFKGSGTIEYSADVILGLDFSALCDNSDEFNIDREKGRIDEETGLNLRKVQTMAIKQRYNASGKNTIVKMDYWPAYDYFEVNQKEEKTSAHKEESKKSREKKGAENKQHTEDPIDFFMYCHTKEEVRQVYSVLAQMYHPDQCGDIEGKMFKIIGAQYEKAGSKFK